MEIAEPNCVELQLREGFAQSRFNEVATLMIREYGLEITRYLSSVLRDSNLAADVFSSACELMWRHLPQFRGQSSFRTWFFAIARNAQSHAVRDPYRRRASALESAPEFDQLEAHVRTVTATFARTETKDRFAHIRSTLTEDEQAILVLRIDRRMTWLEMVDAMAPIDAAFDPKERDRQSASLRKRFERIRARLRSEFTQGNMNA